MSSPRTVPPAALPASFRDPAGRVFVLPDRVLRVVSASGRANLDCFLKSAAVARLAAEGSVVRTRVLEDREAGDALAALGLEVVSGATVCEHERFPFPSFPYEWPPEMLQAAARLTLDLADALPAEHLGLKDATPYNILFRGAQPVFVDALSIEPRDPGDPVWLPLAQFQRMFLLPLMANRYFGKPLSDAFTTRRDGLEPEEIYRQCGPLRRLLPPFLGTVSLPTWLASRATDTAYQPRRESPDKAAFILRSNLRGLRRSLERVAPEARDSRWSRYTTETHTYAPKQLEAKTRFVREALEELRPARVLDAGCNTGDYSLLAAANGAEVVAIDSDPTVVGRLWQQASSRRLPILPLVVDLARPSAALGWRNRECPSFLDRALGQFDLVLMLALVHHLLVTERIPLADVADLAADLTRESVLLEWVGQEDPMFQRLTRGRSALYTHLTREAFESEFARRFQIARTLALPRSARVLYLAKRR